MKTYLHEFKKFISRGNVIDLAVGVIIGASFEKIVSSLVGDVVIPVIALVTGKVDVTSWNWGPVAVGNFVQAVLNFILIATVIFVVIKLVNRFRVSQEALPPAPSREQVVLEEIRDILKTNKE